MPVQWNLFRKMLLGIGLVALAAPGTAQQKIGVIDVARIMTESNRGQKVLADIEEVQAERAGELQTLNDELTDLQRRFQEGRLSLAEDRLLQLQAEIEDKTRLFERAREDAQRVVQKRRTDDIQKVEAEVFPIINAVGEEMGYSLLFNKFQSGLVFAEEAVDITDLVIERFNATTGE